MQKDLKTTVKEHPAETVAVVAVVGLVGTVLYCRWQNRKHQLELARIELDYARQVIEASRLERSRFRLDSVS